MSFRLNLTHKLRGKGEISTSDLSYLPQTNKAKVAELFPGAGSWETPSRPSPLLRLWNRAVGDSGYNLPITSGLWSDSVWKLNQGVLPRSKILGWVCKRAATCYALCFLYLTGKLLLGIWNAAEVKTPPTKIVLFTLPTNPYILRKAAGETAQPHTEHSPEYQQRGFWIQFSINNVPAVRHVCRSARCSLRPHERLRWITGAPELNLRLSRWLWCRADHL